MFKRLSNRSRERTNGLLAVSEQRTRARDQVDDLATLVTAARGYVAAGRAALALQREAEDLARAAGDLYRRAVARLKAGGLGDPDKLSLVNRVQAEFRDQVLLQHEALTDDISTGSGGEEALAELERRVDAYAESLYHLLDPLGR